MDKNKSKIWLTDLTPVWSRLTADEIQQHIDADEDITVYDVFDNPRTIIPDQVSQFEDLSEGK